MKQIIIYQENTSPIIIEDDDLSKIEEFSRNLSGLLETGNVSILHTSSGSVVLRPNKISSIVVHEVERHINTDVQLQKEPIKIEEDIITD
jgi:hypothetical protein